MGYALFTLVAVAGLAAAVAWTRLPRRTPHRPVRDGDGPFAFPAGFVWGVGTADHQVEHSAPDNWTAFEETALKEGRGSATPAGGPVPGHIRGITAVPPHVVSTKSDFNRQYAADLGRAAELGCTAFRFSMSWARMFPREEMVAPAQEAIDFYGAVLDACKTNHLAPSVTLLHFASPQWLWRADQLPRGLERSDAPARFEQLAQAMARTFGDRVRHWCTINEPMVTAYSGYLEGVFPPNEQRGSPTAVVPVGRALLQMHARAYRALHDDAQRRGTAASVGIAQHVRVFQPFRNAAPLDRLTARFIDQAFVLDFLDAIHTGEYRPSQTGHHETIAGLAGTQDYVGVNYYGRFYVKTKITAPGKFDLVMHDANEPGEEWSDLNWAADETGFTDTLVRFAARYGKPIEVLENGTADAAADDTRRQRGIVRHTQAVWRAIQQGVDVRSYYHWSLIDNFEWAEGFSPRFGLYAVDYDHDFRRTARPSAALFAAIATRNAISAEAWRAHRR